MLSVYIDVLSVYIDVLSVYKDVLSVNIDAKQFAISGTHWNTLFSCLVCT